MVKRSIYLINPKFQLRFSFFVSSLVFLSSLIYPITIYEVINQVTVHLGPEAQQSLINNRFQLITILVIYQLVFTAIVFIVCVFQSHKIAGPLYKLVKTLKEITSLHNLKKMTFRKNDHFQEVATEFNNAMGRIVDEQNRDFAYLSEINSYLKNLALAVPEDKKVVLMEITSKLNHIQEHFEEKN